MRKLYLVFFVLLASLLAAQEIRRPTTAINAANISNQANAYDTDANTYASIDSDADYYGNANDAGATFGSWQAPSGSYSRLRLNVKSSCTSYGSYCEVDVSLDGGSTWASFRTPPPNSYGYGLATWTAELPPNTDLSLLRVQVYARSFSQAGDPCLNPPDCTQYADPAAGWASAYVYDIWTEGWLGPTPSPVIVRPTYGAADPTNYSQFCASSYYNHFSFNAANAYDTSDTTYAALHTNYSGMQYQMWADTGYVGGAYWQTKPAGYAQVLKYKVACSGYSCDFATSYNSGTNWAAFYVPNNSVAVTNSVILDSNQSLSGVMLGACSKAYNYTAGNAYIYDVRVEVYPQSTPYARRRISTE
jgi:hypothetical protein